MSSPLWPTAMSDSDAFNVPASSCLRAVFPAASANSSFMTPIVCKPYQAVRTNTTASVPVAVAIFIPKVSVRRRIVLTNFLVQNRAQAGEFLVGQDLIDIKQDFDLALQLGHPQQVLAG